MAILNTQSQIFPSYYNDNYIIFSSSTVGQNYKYVLDINTYDEPTIHLIQKPHPVNNMALVNPYTFVKSNGVRTRDFDATTSVDASDDFKMILISVSGMTGTTVINTGTTQVITSHNHIVRDSLFDLNDYFLTGTTKEFLTKQKTNKVRINDNATLSFFNGTFADAGIVHGTVPGCLAGAARCLGIPGDPGSQYLYQTLSNWNVNDNVTIEFDVLDFGPSGNMDFIMNGINTIFTAGHYSYSSSSGYNGFFFFGNEWFGNIANVSGYNYTLGQPLNFVNGDFSNGLNGWLVNGWEHECVVPVDIIVTLPTSQINGMVINTYDKTNNDWDVYLIDLEPQHVEPVQVTSSFWSGITSTPNCASHPGASGTDYTQYLNYATDYDPFDDWVNRTSFTVGGMTTGTLMVALFGQLSYITSNGQYTIDTYAGTDADITFYAQNNFDGYVTDVLAASQTVYHPYTILNNDFSEGTLNHWTNVGWVYGHTGTTITPGEPILTGFTAGKLIIPSGPENVNAATKYHILNGTIDPVGVNWINFNATGNTNTIIDTNTDYYTINTYYANSHNVTTAITTSETITYNLDECDKRGIDYFRLGWFNPIGGWDYFNFVNKSAEVTTVDKSNYLKNNFEFNGGTYTTNPSKAGLTPYKIDATKRYIINSGWLSDNDARLIEQMVLSPEVYWLNDTTNAGYEIPIIILNKEIEVKKSQFGKLIQYTIEFQLSNNIPTQI